MSEMKIRSAGTRPTYEELEADLRDIRAALNNANAKEEREAWDRYFAAKATAVNVCLKFGESDFFYTIEEAAEQANAMLEERRKRWSWAR